MPVLIEDLFHGDSVAFASALGGPEAVGNHPQGFDGFGFSSRVMDKAFVGEEGVGTPGKKIHFVVAGVVVAEEVVSIAGVAIPESQQPFDGPKPVERVHVDVVSEDLLQGLGLLA